LFETGKGFIMDKENIMKIGILRGRIVAEEATMPPPLAAILNIL
jgi:hypothetical protein